MAVELGEVCKEVRQLRRIPRQAHYPLDDDEWDEVLSAPQIDDCYDRTEMERIVADALSELPERQAKVIRMRFGIGHDEEMTLEKIGELYGVTRERIRQIEAKGLESLSHPARKRRLKTMLGM